MGPWYILMDEFLASGETIVRNLQMGIERGAAFGGVMEVGYLPDMFGHIAQMPQILRQAGFDARRGVARRAVARSPRTPSSGRRPTGRPCGPSTCPSATATAPRSPTTPRRWCAGPPTTSNEVGRFLITGDLLCMNGSDHLMPQPWLGRVVAEANDLQDEFGFEVTSLPDYLADGAHRGPDHWSGASCARASGPTC